MSSISIFITCQTYENLSYQEGGVNLKEDGGYGFRVQIEDTEGFTYDEDRIIEWVKEQISKRVNTSINERWIHKYLSHELTWTDDDGVVREYKHSLGKPSSGL